MAAEQTISIAFRGVIFSDKSYKLQADAKRSTALQPYKLQLFPNSEETSEFHDVINWLSFPSFNGPAALLGSQRTYLMSQASYKPGEILLGTSSLSESVY